ncbi:hypothetical protein M885DRAFT_530171 [Pelagophyceae sp. CCMP2097]|nr:hypothetical protein M885DRAFT_530171 [Pelagophyceae sp. CCMP2097]
MVAMDRLSNELVGEIFGNLEPLEAVEKAPACKAFAAALALSLGQTHRLAFARAAAAPLAAGPATGLVARCPGLRELRISACRAAEPPRLSGLVVAETSYTFERRSVNERAVASEELCANLTPATEGAEHFDVWGDENDAALPRLAALAISGPVVWPRLVFGVSATLVSLDLSFAPQGAALFVRSAVSFPRLRDVRLAGERGGAASEYYLDFGAALGDLGGRCPALRALDVGYSHWLQGIDVPHVEALLRATDMVALDLSQVMTWVDFDPICDLLTLHAPRLRALAVHGLALSDAGLAALQGCADLSRLHLVGCRFAAQALVPLIMDSSPPGIVWPADVPRRRGLAVLDVTDSVTVSDLGALARLGLEHRLRTLVCQTASAHFARGAYRVCSGEYMASVGSRSAPARRLAVILGGDRVRLFHGISAPFDESDDAFGADVYDELVPQPAPDCQDYTITIAPL